MNKALFAALASVALLGASCSVQEFAPVVIDKPTITASLPDSFEAAITVNTITKYYGKYAFRFGVLSTNQWYSFRSTSQNGFTEEYVPLQPSTTYTINRIVNSGGQLFFFNSSESEVGNIGYPGSSFTFTTPNDCAYGIFQLAPGYTPNLCLGSILQDYQPYVYGFSYDTPITGAGAIACGRDRQSDSGYPNDVGVYSDANFRLSSHSVQWNFSGASDVGQIFIDMLETATTQGSFQNMDWEPNTEGWHEVGFGPSQPAWPAYCEFYIEDRYQAGYEDGYYAAERDNGIFNHAYYVSGSDGTNTVTNYIDDSLLEWYSSANTQGLFDPYSLVSFLGLASDATTYTITIQYGEVYASANFPIAAYPLYVDVLADGVVEDTSLCPYLSISTYRGGSIRGNTLFAADFTNSYAGLAVGYPNYGVYNREYDSFNRISLVLPKNQSYADMRQIGVVSPYARGFVDGVNSRDGEVDDLTDRILALQNDLSQYQGKTYEQIYNLGLQAALNEGTAASGLMNSLIGSVVGVPLTILNNLTGLSMFGLPVMSAIFSLLIVAVVLWLYRRFKS